MSQDFFHGKAPPHHVSQQHHDVHDIIFNAPIGIFTSTPDGRFISANPALARMYGYRSPQEMIESITDLAVQTYADPAERDLFVRLIEEQGEIVDHECLLRKKDGSCFWASRNARAIRDDTGKILCFQGFTIDITARKEAELELKASKERLHSIFRVAPTGIGVVCHRSFTEINERICEMTGYSAAELIGRNARILYPTQEEYEYVGSEKYRQIANQGTGVVETRWQHKNGTIINVLMASTPLDPEDLTKGVTFTALDITPLKELEQERNRISEQLLQSQKLEAIGRLAGGVAHDFNNMLGVILGHTDMAIDDLPPGHPLLTNLREINQAAERSTNLTRQLLAFARRQVATPRVVDLNEMVTATLRMLQRLIGEGIELLWQPGDVHTVLIDPIQIDQILVNLCINARDAIGDMGKIIIQTRNETIDTISTCTINTCSPGDYAVLQISDNGCGMTRDTLDNLFEPFFTTKDIGKGTGLGLATVYGIVRQNNGFIHVESELHQGSSFSIYLPRHQARPEPETIATDRRAKSADETILLVEDEQMILDMTKTILERQGYHVITAHTPTEAISRARAYEGPIHLLLTDVVMPEMNGRDLARRLLSYFPTIKTLYMSGYTADIIARHGILEDGIRFIQKPFSSANLKARLRELLDTPSH